MKVIQILALPISLLYGIIVRLRNFLYNQNIISSESFDIPTICVGNLSVGGTGKSPHLEYIVDLLGTENIASLSRGYGRKTTGFLMVNEDSVAENVGDEPLQFKKKYKQLIVAVCENRAGGIKKIIKQNPQIKAIILDDAFQHRKIKPGLSILLTDYSQPYYKDLLLPSGTLREPKNGAKRADIIIVTKTPELILDAEKENIKNKINPLSHQRVYFSKIVYGDFIPLSAKAISDTEVIKEFFFDANYSILLFTGIANSEPLKNYLQTRTKELIHVSFADHHQYKEHDIQKIFKRFDAIQNKYKIILTTEKDYMRLGSDKIKKLISEKPVYYVPIKISFDEKDKINFHQQIKQYVEQNKRSY